MPGLAQEDLLACLHRQAPEVRIDDLRHVLHVLQGLDVLSQKLFFEQPKASLARPATGQPRTPLQALREGHLDAVLRAARGLAQR